MIDDAEVVARLRDAHDTAPVILTDPAPVIVTARRRRRRLAATRTAGALAAAAVAFVVVTGTWRPDGPAPVAEQGGSDPLGLVGMWSVEAEGEAPETLLTLGGSELRGLELTLHRSCGPLQGSWIAGRAAFAASIWSWPAECPVPSQTAAAAWLESAVSYTALDGGWALTDAEGMSVAVLALASDGQAELTATPEVTEEIRMWLAPAGPLPSGLLPATTEDVVGRWIPRERTANDDAAASPFVELSPNGTWTGADGCNRGEGRWAVESGRLLSFGGVSTEMGCNGVPVPAWMEWGEFAGFEGEELVLVDGAGAELGRLVRDGGAEAHEQPDPAPTSQDPDTTRATAWDPAEGSDPLGLVGVWTVEADGEDPSTLLWLGESPAYRSPYLILRRECGTVAGSWFAGNAAFAGTVDSWAETCPLPAPAVDWAPAWLASAVAYSPEGDGWVLTDVDGNRTATLSPGTPAPGPDGRGGLSSEPRCSPSSSPRRSPQPEPHPGGSYRSLRRPSWVAGSQPGGRTTRSPSSPSPRTTRGPGRTAATARAVDDGRWKPDGFSRPAAPRR